LRPGTEPDPGLDLRDAERAAELLREALRALGWLGDIAGTRAVRDVVQRPVVQFGTMPPQLARQVADRLLGRRPLTVVPDGDSAPGPVRTPDEPA
jgi:hypothetical protein